MSIASIMVALDTGEAAARRVRLASGATLAYDHLVVATGARHSYFGNDAWEEHAPGIKTIDDATRVRRDVLLALERAETERQEDLPRRAEHITFAVIGGGPMAAELGAAGSEPSFFNLDLDGSPLDED